VAQARAIPVVAAETPVVGNRWATTRFDWAMVLVASLPMAGAYLDAWAHSHVPSLETFFTPWHAVLYTGLLAITAFMAVSFALGYRRTHDWRTALPAGYGLSLVGCLMFAAGGVADMAWHLAFGIEQDFQAALSPTHLFLMLSLGLIVAGPLRAGWRGPGRSFGFPALLSAGLLLSTVSFFQAFDHPFVTVRALTAGIDNEELGVIGIVIESGVVTALALALVRRFDLPLGGLAFVLGLNAALLTAIGNRYSMVVVAVAAGLVADLVRVLNADRAGVRSFRLFAFALPTLVFAFYFANVARLGGVAWSTHVWVGSIAVAGAVGWLISYVMVPSGQTDWRSA
jgi:hypothetical protein